MWMRSSIKKTVIVSRPQSTQQKDPINCGLWVCRHMHTWHGLRNQTFQTNIIQEIMKESFICDDEDAQELRTCIHSILVAISPND